MVLWSVDFATMRWVARRAGGIYVTYDICTHQYPCVTFMHVIALVWFCFFCNKICSARTIIMVITPVFLLHDLLKSIMDMGYDIRQLVWALDRVHFLVSRQQLNDTHCWFLANTTFLSYWMLKVSLKTLCYLGTEKEMGVKFPCWSREFASGVFFTLIGTGFLLE